VNEDGYKKKQSRTTPAETHPQPRTKITEDDSCTGNRAGKSKKKFAKQKNNQKSNKPQKSARK